MSCVLSLLAVLAIALLGVVGDQRVSSAESACSFRLGFKALHDLIPSIVGECLDDETHNNLNGDGLQRTVGGLLVWRQIDNWTAFTDGTTTWINGPEGLASRPNTGPLYPWEAAPPGPAAEPVPT